MFKVGKNAFSLSWRTIIPARISQLENVLTAIVSTTVRMIIPLQRNFSTFVGITT